MPVIADWLGTSGTDFLLRVNWLWTVQKLGNPNNLITGFNSWLDHESLKEGYSEALFEILLSEPERCAWNCKFFRCLPVGASESLVWLMEVNFRCRIKDLARLISLHWHTNLRGKWIRESIASKRHETDILHVVALWSGLYCLEGILFQAEICGEEAFIGSEPHANFSNKYNSRAGSDELFVSGQCIYTAWRYRWYIWKSRLVSLTKIARTYGYPRVQMLIQKVIWMI